MPIAVTVLRVALGLLLIVTGALKIGHAPDLAAAIAGFRLLPPEIVEPMALILPWLEVFLGCYLVAGLFTRVVGWITVLQFVVYAGVIASAVLRNIPANCGCFGPGDTAVADWPHVAFDLALAVLALVIALRGPGAYALDRRLSRS
jgi:uncharacterized membrane protein YphA (DoxX/SURF4 family)